MINKNPKYKVSIIVCTFNRAQLLKKCLDSLLAQKGKLNFEIVVVDDGSTEEIKNIVAAFNDDKIKYFFQKHQGISAARKRAVEVSSGEILAFIDDDCIASENWLKSLVEALNNKRLAGVGGKIKAVKKRFIDKFSEKYLFNHELVLRNSPTYLITCNCAYRAEVVRRVGSFNSEMIAAEDVDLGWRIYFNGLKLGYCSNAVVAHEMDKNFWVLFKKMFMAGRMVAFLSNNFKGSSLEKIKQLVGPIPKGLDFVTVSFYHLFFNLLYKNVSKENLKKLRNKAKPRDKMFFLIFPLIHFLVDRTFLLGLIYENKFPHTRVLRNY